MSIRKVNKDHLREHAGISLVQSQRILPPTSGNPLVFWTLHPTQPCEVNLTPLALGQAQRKATGGKKFQPFSGRPELIGQMLRSIRESLSYVLPGTAHQTLNVLRQWWRLLDRVEAAAAEAGQTMSRVDDVRLLTPVHAEFAHRSGMNASLFGKFRALVDSVRIELGARPTYWENPENDKSEKHLPMEDQRKALRIAVKRECRKVLARWALCDELKVLSTPPEDVAQVKLWRCVQHLKAVQQRTERAFPTVNALNNENHRKWAYENLGMGPPNLLLTSFPSHLDAHAIWTQCLINTPWNPSTLLSLDVTKPFLIDHFKDDPTDPHRRWIFSAETYKLVGEKERAGGKEQFIVGMWKSEDGPGHLIKTYLARVEPLRDALKAELVLAKASYNESKHNHEDASAKFSKIIQLEQGCRSVWLYVDFSGKIKWLNAQTGLPCSIDRRGVTYLEEVRHQLNLRRAELGISLIPKVSPRDFRVWYADYVYRAGNGSILAVKAALNHSQLRTTIGYVNTNILNQESSDAARRFLDILVGELDRGRIDFTILAYLFRHGTLTQEQEKLLVELRTLPKSRVGIACKDARNPPAHLKASPGGEACDVQRCLLCVEHAVLLPESLDGIVMREAELHAVQGHLSAVTWVEDRYDIELENHKQALRRFDLNKVTAARKNWAKRIASGEHIVPGLPMEAQPSLMELN